MSPPTRRLKIVILVLTVVVIVQCLIIWALWDLTGELQQSIDQLRPEQQQQLAPPRLGSASALAISSSLEESV